MSSRECVTHEYGIVPMATHSPRILVILVIGIATVGITSI